MKVKVVQNHPGAGQFPAFPKGTTVTLTEKEPCTHFLHWWACDISGHATYVPECFVRDGKLIRDYNPTELIQKTGDILEVREIVYAWLLATNAEGTTGWIPAEVVVSVAVD